MGGLCTAYLAESATLLWLAKSLQNLARVKSSVVVSLHAGVQVHAPAQGTAGAAELEPANPYAPHVPLPDAAKARCPGEVNPTKAQLTDIRYHFFRGTATWNAQGNLEKRHNDVVGCFSLGDSEIGFEGSRAGMGKKQQESRDQSCPPPFNMSQVSGFRAASGG